MKTFEQVGDIFTYIGGVHCSLATYYLQLVVQDKIARNRLLFAYLAHHHQRQAELLRGYEKVAPAALTKRWLQFVPKQQGLDVVVSPAGNPAKADQEELLELEIRFEDRLSRFYQMLAKSCGNHQLQVLFESLEQEAEQQKHKLARSLASFFDL